MTLRAADFKDRIRAAADSGFDGIGLRINDYRTARAQGWSDAGMRSLVADHGIRVMEVELLRSWWTKQSTESAEEENEAFHIARVFGTRCVNAGLPDGTAQTDLIREYARICRRAEDSGLLVPLEFMPYGAITSLSQANRIVEEAGRPNGGLLIDTWHCHRTGVGALELAQLPPDRVISVQICDAQPVAHSDLRHEARHLRRVPGEGVAGIVEALRALRGQTRLSGAAVEVMSDALDRASPGAAARLTYDATQRVLKESEWD
ncbi:sugar phosphate isomerase/epimerase family protein [Streptomyces sp. NPDC019531]|uniref:sugar phosphate isomerase/epimerase family protein n=1 Tax=Streptomyces sp. NPDC019531 TaxID=3365062 RepID=UPI00384C7A4A